MANSAEASAFEHGERQIPFTKTIYIDATDYEIEPPAGYKRLSPNNPEIRLRNSYILKVNEHKTDDAGNVIELIATIDEHTLGNNPEGRKVKGVIHWVSATHGVTAFVRLYDHLLLEEDEIDASLAQNALGADADADAFWINRHLNPNSLTVYQAVVEPDLAKAAAGERFQFERESYFIADSVEHTQSSPVFNQIVSLKTALSLNNCTLIRLRQLTKASLACFGHG